MVRYEERLNKLQDINETEYSKLSEIPISEQTQINFIQDNINKSYIEVYQSDCSWKYGENGKNTMKIYYPKKYGNFTVFQWVECLELYRMLIPQLFFYFYYVDVSLS